jgi:hypothetical protein
MQIITLFSITEGQLVYAIPGGNAARYKNDPIEMTVSKIGRKYFYCTCGTARTFRFDKETFRYAPTPTDDENSDYTPFESLEGALYHIEANEMRTAVHSVFSSYFARDKIPDRAIEAIYNILVQEKIIKE